MLTEHSGGDKTSQLLILVFRLTCCILSEIEDHAEQAAAIHFFAEFANDVPSYRDYLFWPAGLRLLSENIINVVPDVENLCTNLAALSEFPWCLPAFAEGKLCSTLVQLLM